MATTYFKKMRTNIFSEAGLVVGFRFWRDIDHVWELELLATSPQVRAVRSTARQRIEQVPCWEQRKAENRAPEIKIMPGTVLQAPMHPGKQAKRLENVGENHHNQTSRTEQLQERPDCFLSREQNYGTEKEHRDRDQCAHRLNQGDVHMCLLRLNEFAVRKKISAA